MTKNEDFIIYPFSDIELSDLALFLRKNVSQVPKSLEKLSEFAENYAYKNMTVGEAETFFEGDTTGNF